MSRSLKKGPYIYEKLLKKISVLKPMDGTVVKTWTRDSQISPEMIGFTFGVHNGKDFIQVRITEDMIDHRLGRVQSDQKIRQTRRQDAERNRNQEKRVGNSLGASGQSGAGKKVKMKEITAKLNNYRASPRKTRIVADLIKGKKVKDAIVQLDFWSKNPPTRL